MQNGPDHYCDPQQATDVEQYGFCFRRQADEVLAALKEKVVAGSNYLDEEFVPCHSLCKETEESWRRPTGLKVNGSKADWTLTTRDKTGLTFSPDVIEQGDLGDCWFLSAVAVVCTRTELMRRIFISTEISPEGAYALRFCHNGVWTPVTIDDYLPVRNGSIAYARGKGNVLWPSLIEKAYAKLHGSFKLICKGRARDAFSDLTGVPCVDIDFDNEIIEMDPDTLWAELVKSHSKGYLMAASCGRKGATKEGYREKGLISNHCYTLLQVRQTSTTKLLNLRNPWGSMEWNGKWGKESKLLKNGRKLLDTDRTTGNGSFWMELSDFLKYFSNIDICMMQKDWFFCSEEGVFSKSAVPNGTAQFSDAYVLEVSSPTEALVSIVQRDKRGAEQGYCYKDVAMTVVQVVKEGFEHVGSVVSSVGRITTCEVELKESGTYMVFPVSILNLEEDTSFTLTTWSSKKIAVRRQGMKDLHLLNTALHCMFMSHPLRKVDEPFENTKFVRISGERGYWYFATNVTKKTFRVQLDCSESTGLVSNRGLKTDDAIPPGGSMVLMMLTADGLGHLKLTEKRNCELNDVEPYHTPALPETAHLHVVKGGYGEMEPLLRYFPDVDVCKTYKDWFTCSEEGVFPNGTAQFSDAYVLEVSSPTEALVSIVQRGKRGAEQGYCYKDVAMTVVRVVKEGFEHVGSVVGGVGKITSCEVELKESGTYMVFPVSILNLDEDTSFTLTTWSSKKIAVRRQGMKDLHLLTTALHCMFMSPTPHPLIKVKEPFENTKFIRIEGKCSFWYFATNLTKKTFRVQLDCSKSTGLVSNRGLKTDDAIPPGGSMVLMMLYTKETGQLKLTESRSCELNDVEPYHTPALPETAHLHVVKGGYGEMEPLLRYFPDVDVCKTYKDWFTCSEEGVFPNGTAQFSDAYVLEVSSPTEALVSIVQRGKRDAEQGYCYKDVAMTVVRVVKDEAELDHRNFEHVGSVASSVRWITSCEVELKESGTYMVFPVSILNLDEDTSFTLTTWSSKKIAVRRQGMKDLHLLTTALHCMFMSPTPHPLIEVEEPFENTKFVRFEGKHGFWYFAANSTKKTFRVQLDCNDSKGFVSNRGLKTDDAIPPGGSMVLMMLTTREQTASLTAKIRYSLLNEPDTEPYHTPALPETAHLHVVKGGHGEIVLLLTARIGTITVAKHERRVQVAWGAGVKEVTDTALKAFHDLGVKEVLTIETFDKSTQTFRSTRDEETFHDMDSVKIVFKNVSDEDATMRRQIAAAEILFSDESEARARHDAEWQKGIVKVMNKKKEYLNKAPPEKTLRQGAASTKPPLKQVKRPQLKKAPKAECCVVL